LAVRDTSFEIEIMRFIHSLPTSRGRRTGFRTDTKKWLEGCYTKG